MYLGNGTMQLQPVVGQDFRIFLPGQSDRHALLVKELEERIVGYSLVKPYSDREGYRRAGETSVYLHPDAIGEGYGKRLMNCIISAAKELEYRYLAAKIWTNNQKSIAFHEQLGFRIVGVQRGIGWVEGHPVDVTIMEAQLDELLSD